MSEKISNRRPGQKRRGNGALRAAGVRLELSVVLGLSAALAPVGAAHAQNWIGPNGGDFNTAAYWSGGVVPNGVAANNASGNSISLGAGDNANVSGFASGGAGDLTLTSATMVDTGNMDVAAQVSLVNGSALTVNGTLEADGGLILDGVNRVNGSGSTQYAVLNNATLVNTALTESTADNNYPWAQLNNVTMDVGSSLNTGTRGSIELASTVAGTGPLQFTAAALAAGVSLTAGYQGTIYVDVTATDGAPVLGGTGGSVTVNLAGGSLLAGYGYGDLGGAFYGNTLTLGADLTVLAGNGYNTIGSYGGFTAALVNNGTINASGSPSYTTVSTEGQNLTNNGTIEATAAGSEVTVEPGSGFIANYGLINVANGGTVTLGQTSNLGHVTIDGNANSILYLDGDGANGQYSMVYTPADFALVQAQYGGGGVYLQGQASINIGGGNFDPTMINAPDGIHATNSYGLLHMAEGEIDNGTILHSDLLQWEDDNTTIGGVLNNVTLSGDNNVVLNLTDSVNSQPVSCFAANLSFASGSIFNVGTTPGGGDAYLMIFSTSGGNYSFGPNTGTATVNLGSASTNGYFGFGDNVLAGGDNNDKTFTIDAGVTVQGSGGVGDVYESGYGNSLTNYGVIQANRAGTSLNITMPDDNGDSGVIPGNLNNYGFLYSITSGATLNVTPGATGRVYNEGTIEAMNGGTVQVNGTVYNTGAGVVFSTGSGSSVTLAGGSGTITNTGNGTIGATLGGSVTVTGQNFDQSGYMYMLPASTITLNATNNLLETGSLTDVEGWLNIGAASGNVLTQNGGQLIGDGTITGNLQANGGTVRPGEGDMAGAPGTLTVNGNFVQNAGSTLQIDLQGAIAGVLAVSGDAALNGNLALNNLGATLTAGSHVQIVSFGTNMTGSTFANVANDGVIDLGAQALIATYNNAPGGGVFLTVPITGTTLPGGTGFEFAGAASGEWFDPATAYGFTYTTTDGALFTSAVLPAGFSNPFTVTVDGTVIGTFSGGSTINFGAGVESFEVTGINPEVDPSNDNDFPTYLTFNDPTATFDMTPISGTASAPEPGVLGLVLCGAGGLAGVGRRRREGR